MSDNVVDPDAQQWRVLVRQPDGTYLYESVSYLQACAYAMNIERWREVDPQPSSGFAGWWRRLFG